VRPHRANRLLDEAKGPLDAAALSAIEESNIRVSHVFRGRLAIDPRLAAPEPDRNGAAP